MASLKFMFLTEPNGINWSVYYYTAFKKISVGYLKQKKKCKTTLCKERQQGYIPDQGCQWNWNAEHFQCNPQ